MDLQKNKKKLGISFDEVPDLPNSPGFIDFPNRHRNSNKFPRSNRDIKSVPHKNSKLCVNFWQNNGSKKNNEMLQRKLDIVNGGFNNLEDIVPVPKRNEQKKCKERKSPSKNNNNYHVLKSNTFIKQEDTWLMRRLRELMSLKSLYVGLTIFSLILISTVFSSLFMYFSYLNSLDIFSHEKKTILAFTTTSIDRWLSQGGLFIDRFSGHIRNGAINGYYSSMSFFENTTQGIDDVEKMVRFLLISHRKMEDVRQLSVVLHNGAVYGTKKSGFEYFKRLHFPHDQYDPNFATFKGEALGYSVYNNYTLKEELGVVASNFDPQNDDSERIFLRGVQYDDYVWSLYMSQQEGMIENDYLIATISKNFYGRDMDIAGVVGCHFHLPDFNSFLEDIKTEHGDLIIVDKSTGFFIASSIGEVVPYMKDENSGEFVLVHMADVQNKLIQVIAFEIIRKFGNFSNVEDVEIFHFFQNSLTLKILACSTMNIHNFEIVVIYVADVYTLFSFTIIGDLIAIGMAVVLTAGSLVILCVMLHYMLKPFLHLVDQLKFVETLEFHKIQISKRYLFHEINVLSERLLFMIDKLTEYKRFIPLYLKARPEKGKENEGTKNVQTSSSSTSLSSIGSNNSSRSSCGSLGSNSSDDSGTDSSMSKCSDIHLVDFLKKKMSVHLKDANGYLLIVYFLFNALNDWLSMDLEKELLVHFQEFLDFLLENINGSVIKLDFYCSVIYFKDPTECMNSAIVVKSYLDKVNSEIKKKNANHAIRRTCLKFNVLVHRANFLKGVIGNSSIKLPTVIYNSSLCERILEDFALYSVITTEEVISSVKSDVFVPIDIVMNVDKEKNVLLLYKYIPESFSVVNGRICERNEVFNPAFEIEGMEFFMKGLYQQAAQSFKKILLFYGGSLVNVDDPNCLKKINISSPVLKERLFRAKKFFEFAKKFHKEDFNFNTVKSSSRCGKYSSFFFNI